MPIHLTIHKFELYEVKISDVSLATCHAFDKEISGAFGPGRPTHHLRQQAKAAEGIAFGRR
jgi:hypothetical protein